jgi:hypothetical protein
LQPWGRLSPARRMMKIQAQKEKRNMDDTEGRTQTQGVSEQNVDDNYMV